MTYTAKAIADLLGRPATTIRTWADSYKDFIPVGTKKGGRRRYNENGLAVFRKIEQLHNDGIIGDEVREQLRQAFPLQMEAGDESYMVGNDSNSLILRQEYLQMTNYFTAVMNKYDELIALQREELTLLKNRLGVGSETPKNNGKTWKPKIKVVENSGNDISKIHKLHTNKTGGPKKLKKIDKVENKKKNKSWFSKLFS